MAENAIFVADAVSDRRDVERRQRVHETGGQPAQAAVAQARLNIQLAELGQVDAVALHRVLGQRISVRVKQVLFQLLPNQILGGQVIDELGILAEIAIDVLLPEIHHVIAHRVGERENRSCWVAV